MIPMIIIIIIMMMIACGISSWAIQINVFYATLYSCRILTQGGAPQTFSFLNVLMFYVLKQVKASILKVLTLF